MISAEMRCDFPSDFNCRQWIACRVPIAADRSAVVYAGFAGWHDESGFIMIEQLQSLDRQARGAALIERVLQSLLDDVKSRIATMLDLQLTLEGLA